MRCLLLPVNPLTVFRAVEQGGMLTKVEEQVVQADHWIDEGVDDLAEAREVKN